MLDWQEKLAVIVRTFPAYHFEKGRPGWVGELRLNQILILSRQAAHMLLRESWPVKQLIAQMANQHGGYYDTTDPKYPAFKVKLQKEAAKEPKRLTFKPRDFVEKHEFYFPLLERLEQDAKSGQQNELDDVPQGILLEVQADLKAKELPRWYSQTFPHGKLREAIGQVKHAGEQGGG